MAVREDGIQTTTSGSDPLEVVRGAFGDDWLADQLPGVLASDPFLRRFLRIFQDVADPLRWSVEHLDHLVTPSIAPKAALPWLARWIDVPLDITQPDAEQREYLKRAGKGSPRTDAPREVRGFGDAFLEGGIARRGTVASLQGYLETFLEPTDKVEVSDSGTATGSGLPANMQPTQTQQPRPTGRRSVTVKIVSDMVVEDHSPELHEAAVHAGERAKLRIKDLSALIYELVPIGTDIEIRVQRPATNTPAAGEPATVEPGPPNEGEA